MYQPYRRRKKPSLYVCVVGGVVVVVASVVVARGTKALRTLGPAFIYSPAFEAETGSTGAEEALSPSSSVSPLSSFIVFDAFRGKSIEPFTTCDLCSTSLTVVGNRVPTSSTVRSEGQG